MSTPEKVANQFIGLMKRIEMAASGRGFQTQVLTAPRAVPAKPQLNQVIEEIMGRLSPEDLDVLAEFLTRLEP